MFAFRPGRFEIQSLRAMTIIATRAIFTAVRNGYASEYPILISAAGRQNPAPISAVPAEGIDAAS
jgi:hypothetical protein